jgi:hypothetical protein
MDLGEGANNGAVKCQNDRVMIDVIIVVYEVLVRGLIGRYLQTYFHISCFWTPMAMPSYLPSLQTQRFWVFR